MTAMADVLVVDDMQDVAEVVTLFGHEVRVAYCGTQALHEMERHLPDVVLVNLDMAAMNGYRLARRIRERWGEGIRLVAYTAYPRSRVATDVTDAGFDAFVSKSARPLELALAIRGRRALRDLRTIRPDRRKSPRSGSSRRRASDGGAQVTRGNAAD